MMHTTDLARRFDYGYWANARLFQVIAQLTPEQFTQDVSGSYGSVRNTLVHMLSAEWGWLDRCGGAKRGPPLKAADYPTLPSVIVGWQHVETELRRFLAGLQDADLERIVVYTNPRGETRHGALGALMEHAANHGVHHRGQVALLVRALGHAPGNVDLLFYDAERTGNANAG